MNKIIVLISLIFGINTHIECMKRTLNLHSEQPTKKQKVDNRSILTIRELEQAQQKVNELMQELAATNIQLDYMQAMQERNVGQLYNNLLRGAKNIMLDFAVGLKFDEGVKIILKYGNPSKLQLNRALDIAARTQNFPLATMLIEHGANSNSCIN